MADAAENEPSMEEILSSIRRIINEDEEEAPAAEAEAAPAEEESNSQTTSIRCLTKRLPLKKNRQSKLKRKTCSS